MCDEYLHSTREGGDASHGTDDVDGFGDDYVSAARGLLDAWVNHRDDLAEGALQPFQNAENIAAAATGEYIFVLNTDASPSLCCPRDMFR